MRKSLIIGLVVAGILGFGGISVYTTINSEYNAGMTMETQLSEQYQKNQNQLDASTKKIVESVGIANLQSERARKIISDAVKGRYEGKMEPGTGGAMFSAIKEAYPQLDLSIYNKIVDLINAEREAFKNQQDLLLSKLQTYKQWKSTGILRQWFVTKYFPSTNLEARIGTKVYNGAAALEQIQLIVTSQGTDDAFTSGKQGPIDFQPK
ncbi:MAG: hypothetical protein IPG59_11835 [Candidatus Melainabacteria bacterium]|nr:MAG: hypothetical protein IPG59_11835 [Candidatus Melainabacteria bacterium]